MPDEAKAGGGEDAPSISWRSSIGINSANFFLALAAALSALAAVGGVLGPISTGALTQYLGYAAAFGVFAGIAALVAVLFVGFMPETMDSKAT